MRDSDRSALALVFFALSACGGTAKSPLSPEDGEGKKDDELTESDVADHSDAPTAVIIEPMGATVLALREPTHALEAKSIAEALLSKFHSGVASVVAEAFTDDLLISGSSSRIFAPGPAPRRQLMAMINYPGELQSLGAVRLRDVRASTRRSIGESASPLLMSALRSLPPPAPAEVVLIVTFDTPSRVLFPSRGRTILLLREEQEALRIRAIVDDAAQVP